MSTSPIALSSALSSSQEQSPIQKNQQDFNKLATSIQSGNLAAAQQAFSSLQQQHNVAGPESADSSSNNNISADFKAVGQAIQSGNATAAKAAFSKLQSDLKTESQSTSSTPAHALAQKLKHRRHKHHGAGAQSTGSSTASTDTTGSSAGSTGSTGATGQTVNILA